MTIALIDGAFDPPKPEDERLLQQVRRYGQVHVLLHDDGMVNIRQGACHGSYNARKRALLDLGPVWDVHKLKLQAGMRETIEDLCRQYPQQDLTYCTTRASGSIVSPVFAERKIPVIYEVGK